MLDENSILVIWYQQNDNDSTLEGSINDDVLVEEAFVIEIKEND